MAFRDTILIIDDTPKQLDLLISLLQKDFDLQVASSGKEAIELLKTSQEISLILLDIIMPGMNGYELCYHLKNNEKAKDIPIIFLTAIDEKDYIIEGFNAGAVDYITRPFHPAEVKARINTHLELKHNKDIILKQSSDRKELIQIMCHDLANTASFMSSVLALSKLHDLTVDDLVSDMDIAIKNVTELIYMVKNLSTLDENSRQFPLEKQSLLFMVQESIHILNHQLKEKNIEVTVDIPKHLKITVERVSFINSVLNNLLTNAIKFSYPKSKIILSASEAKGQIFFSVKDFGIGMSTDFKKNLFDIHKLSSRPGTNGEIGTGYGLPLVKKFITVYGGEIEVLSQTSDQSEIHGTTVNITFPKK